MKQFAVELKRTSYVTIYVEADTKEQAEDMAWDELLNGRGDISDAEWSVETIEATGEAK